jgi:hypothetical protein
MRSTLMANGFFLKKKVKCFTFLSFTVNGFTFFVYLQPKTN